MYDPRLLLLDEPLSNLDAKLREEARIWLRALIERLHISAVMVTHDQSEALAVADRILLLDRGAIVQDARPAEIYDAPATLFAAEFMGANNRFEGTVAEVRGGEARITGEGWALWGQLRAERRPGDRVSAVIRLERTLLAREPGENRLPARLETALFLGERWDCLLQAASLRVRLWSASSPAEAPCWVGFPRKALWIFQVTAAARWPARDTSASRAARRTAGAPPPRARTVRRGRSSS